VAGEAASNSARSVVVMAADGGGEL
jgi:hypothetical protein